MPPADTIHDEAALWLVRTRDPGFRDWPAFTAWLEADPACGRAYDAMLDIHDVAGELSRSPELLPVIAPAFSSRRLPLIWGTGIAAALIATVAAVTLPPRHDYYAVATAPGEQRTLTLADGTAIALNGATKLTLDRRDPRRTRLDTGEANFTVVHDPSDPFTVESGGTIIRDAGTVFNVVRSPGATEVAVAEGEVLYDPDGAALRMTAGRTLYDRDRGVTEVGDADPATIGLWRSGRLSYRAATLERVAGDLTRMIGEPVQVAPELMSRQFSGTIMVRGVQRERLFARLGTMLAVSMRHDPRGWHLTPEASAPR